ncbi:uncharacterized protein N7477_010267 [Penicillium maclennaniae]|uniref:uncharacterized protein n=1 Tax=Penicillium maclennaniae TaxID=1343394 RepID=UPI002542298E|nr:uncharacterized protein N7477_010267 [Penicillium maclennaniae]KAJ5662651.1 hypothetical protein N7477_010267 [Penicillium maclennaniae]
MDMSMATPTAAATSSSSSMYMGMGMGSGSSCKVSVSQPFFPRTESWHITSHGMFAGSCIGVICLVICLEFLRRLGKEYDRFLVREHRLRLMAIKSDNSVKTSCAKFATPMFTPTIIQQAIRALFHMAQFAVAYFVMLLAMYYNGYFIICIFIGAYIGSFLFSWESISLAGNQQAIVANEATVCCG